MSRLFGLVSVVILFPVVAEAQRTLRVPSAYKTISDAVAAANHHDTVLVAPGIYRETVVLSGKAVRLRSEAGATATTIEASYGKAAVVIESDEGNFATVEGFTITGGQNSGVYIKYASPTIADCRIERNRGVSWWDGMYVKNWHCEGGGVYCIGSAARLLRCYVLENRCSATGEYGGSGYAYGGGIYASSSQLLVSGCYIGGNQVSAEPAPYVVGYAWARGGGIAMGAQNVVVNTVIAWNRAYSSVTIEGGGAYASSSSARIVNSNIWGNSVWRWPPADSAGVSGGSCTNCIIRQNTPLSRQAYSSLDHCDIEGGATGPGNFDLDPKFTPEAQRLEWDSPCRNRGRIVPELPFTDFEGHPRVADGQVDVGLDEFYVRLDVSGRPEPGGRIEVTITGEPAKRTFWALALEALDPPLQIPGLQGVLVVNLRGAAVFDLGPLPSTGRITFGLVIPDPFPVTTFTMQALMHDQFSLPRVVTVR